MYKEKLEFLIEDNNIKKRNLAKLISISESCFNHYVKEKDTMPIKHLNTLCNFFNVSIDYIFKFSKNNNYNYTKTDINTVLSGERLREIRKNYKLTQNKLAAILNSDQSTIAKYERGTNIIATPFLYTICKKYNISADYLLGKIDFIPNWCNKYSQNK